MTAATAVRVKRFTASRDHDCGAGCGTPIVAGTQVGYITGVRTAACPACCDKAEEIGEVAIVGDLMPTSTGPVLQITAPVDTRAATTPAVEVTRDCPPAQATAPSDAPMNTDNPQGYPPEVLAELGDWVQSPTATAPAQLACPTAPPRILITGSRDWVDATVIRRAIEQAIVELCGTVDLHEGVTSGITVVHGGARGADTLADQIAHDLGCKVEIHPALWDTEGKSAGPRRNQRMVELGANVCLAFPTDTSRGTPDCITRAQSADIPVRVHQPAAPVVSVREAEVAQPHTAEQQTAETLAADGATADADQPDTFLEEHLTVDIDPLTDLSVWAAEATGRGTDPEHVGKELVEAFRLGILAGDLRGRQREIGPSEVGHPCARALAYRLAGVPHTGSAGTPWRQAVGTAMHERGDLWAHLDNERRGTRWLTNLRVSVGELYPGREIRGTLDYLDVLTATVVDLKVPGTTAMKTYGPGKPEAEQYEKQVQLYGRGVLRSGFLPAYVGVLRVSPARELAEAIYKVQPFDEQIGARALDRAGGIARMVDAIGPSAAAALPPTDHYCARCDWYMPGATDLTTGCPGAPGAVKPRRDQLDALVS